MQLCVMQVAIAEYLDLDDLSIGHHQDPDKIGPSSSPTAKADIVIEDSASASIVFTHPCRCSGQYQLQEAELSEDTDSIVVGCSSCSLHIKVSYSVC